VVDHVAKVEVRWTERKTLYIGTIPGHGYMLAPHQVMAEHVEWVWHEMEKSRRETERNVNLFFVTSKFNTQASSTNDRFSPIPSVNIGGRQFL